ncbi:schlafen-like protein 1, partial [Ascaphus truei]|uniref:schlafen-like protein 1 n=1 Tax=Ascaphus truei TaxID=8439 RepID=UPI003F59A296
FVCAAVRLGENTTYQTVAEKLRHVSAVDPDLLKELVMQDKTLVVSKDGKNFTAIKYLCHQKSGNVLQLCFCQKWVTDQSLPPQATHGRERAQEEAAHKQPNGITLTDKPPTAEERAAAILAATKSEGAIERQQILRQERLFYGALMGSETRNVEYKRGPGECMYTTLKEYMRKHVCAFLNSEGGSLYVGVEDTGVVVGLELDHRDVDRIRVLADSIFKGFRPPVFPESYSLGFIPVVKAGDSGLFLKVMRLTVHPCQQQAEPMLYETDKGKVYLRRDGSVEGPLTGSAVQEWCRKKWTTELKKREETMDVLLKEKASLQQHIRSLEEQQRQIANSPKVQSKACITM